MTDDCNHGDFVCFDESNKDRNLVLDVIDGHKVVLSRKVRLYELLQSFDVKIDKGIFFMKIR